MDHAIRGQNDCLTIKSKPQDSYGVPLISTLNVYKASGPFFLHWLPSLPYFTWGKPALWVCPGDPALSHVERCFPYFPPNMAFLPSSCCIFYITKFCLVLFTPTQYILILFFHHALNALLKYISVLYILFLVIFMSTSFASSTWFDFCALLFTADFCL